METFKVGDKIIITNPRTEGFEGREVYRNKKGTVLFYDNKTQKMFVSFTKEDDHTSPVCLFSVSEVSKIEDL